MQLCFTKPGSAYSFRTDRFRAFSLHCSSLALVWLQGGVHLRAFYQPALQTRTHSFDLDQLELSNHCLAQTFKRAWRRNPLRKSLSTTSLPTTSFRRAASTIAFPTTSFTATSSSGEPCFSMLWFSFLFNIFFSNSFRGKELVEHNELSQTVLEQELEELLADKPCPLDPLHDHLGQENLWSVQLQQNNLEKNKQQHQEQLSATVLDRELSQLHLHQLCLQYPASKISRQLPEGIFVF